GWVGTACAKHEYAVGQHDACSIADAAVSTFGPASIGVGPAAAARRRYRCPGARNRIVDRPQTGPDLRARVVAGYIIFATLNDDAAIGQHGRGVILRPVSARKQAGCRP